MHKYITIAILGLTITATAGCANGPIRRFFHGAACNSCQPAMGQSLWNNSGGDNACGNGRCSSDGQPGSFDDSIAPETSGTMYGQPGFDPFSGGQIVTPPANTGVLPGPR